MDGIKNFKDRFIAASFVGSVFLVSLIAFADPIVEPGTPGDALKMISPLLDAFKNKNWTALAALLIMLLVYGVRSIGLPFLKDKPQVLPIVSGFLGCLASISISLYSGTPVWSAILGGLFIGAAASGLWETVFKFILPTKAPAAAPAPASVDSAK